MIISSSFMNILTIIALIHSSFQCQPFSKVPDLFTGQASFTLPLQSNNTRAYTFQTYNFTTPRPYSRNTYFSYCFSIKEMSISTSNIQFIDLLILKSFDSKISLSFIYQPNKINRIVYNYCLSYRNDLLFGVQTFLQNQLTKTGDKYKIESRVDINNENSSDSYIVMAFLNGIRSKSVQDQQNYLSFSLQHQYLNYTALTIIFNYKSPLSLVSVTISYAIYAPEKTSFGSYGGIISQVQFKGKHYKNIHYLFPNNNFQAIYGISALDNSNKAQNSFNFISQLSFNYTFSYSANEWDIINNIEISYIIFGNMPSSICQKVKECQSEGNIFIHQQKCINECPNTTKIVNYIDGAIECQNCLINQYYSKNSRSCQCNEGFKADEHGQCVKINPQIISKVTNARENEVDTLQVQNSNLLDRCLTLVNIQKSHNNLFVKLRALPQVSQDNLSSEKNFIKINFIDKIGPHSYYCNKCPNEKDTFECLILFAKGVPDDSFNMEFQCSFTINKIKQNCSQVVPYQSIKNNK